jgi:hypothetical protein
MRVVDAAPIEPCAACGGDHPRNAHGSVELALVEIGRAFRAGDVLGARRWTDVLRRLLLAQQRSRAVGRA